MQWLPFLSVVVTLQQAKNQFVESRAYELVERTGIRDPRISKGVRVSGSWLAVCGVRRSWCRGYLLKLSPFLSAVSAC